MKRKAIIIESSQVPKLDDLNGARKDARNWNNFLMSDVGGAWSSNEINVLHTPLKSELLAAISSCSVDYLFVAFSGHGGIECDRDVICLKDGDIPINLLKRFISDRNPKATLVLDCCRSEEENPDIKIERSRSMFESTSQTRTFHRDSTVYCRTGSTNFSEKVGRSIPFTQSSSPFSSKWIDSLTHRYDGLVTMWACSRGESAGEDSSTTSNKGGFFTTALIKGALKWDKQTTIPYLIYTTADAFIGAKQFMHDPQQNPEYEPEWLAYPFAISTL